MTVTPKPARLSHWALIYVWTVVAVGAAVVSFSVLQLYAAGVDQQWFILVGLTLLTGSFTIRIAALPARVSVSETFVFASVLLFGPAAGTVTVVLETLVISFWQHPSSRSAHRILFNIAAPSVAIWASAQLFFELSGVNPFSHSAIPLPALFVPLAVFTSAYFLLNTWLVAVALGLERHQSPLEIWWPKFTWVSLNYFSGASVAALLVAYSSEIDFTTLIIIVPLLVISYLTFRTAMGRVDDANEHLAELNRLHLSTIETLAMAIDAKDQITHGHIRRVQTYAVGLARETGITDKGIIRAIEAAALLHDMGKLAVPEHILNKPGTLTAAEFERMKLHATVGADILSTIDFPYPVVPIVRHHHENWDGTGYPSRLKGTDIPIGARILAVVDCFDALTSDRPYRTKLSNEAAVEILLDRRGVMYDPLIVDTFLRVHEAIAPSPNVEERPKDALAHIAGLHHSPQDPTLSSAERDLGNADEILSLYELARTIAGQMSISDSFDVVGKHLRRLIPHALSVLYIYDPTTDAIEARHAVGDSPEAVRGLSIPRGHRLSGWVAANRQTILNSDPLLDLGEIARCITPRLKSSISTALTFEEHLVGVLTLYSGTANSFTDDHKRIIEVVARQFGHTFKAASEFESASRHDNATGLPTVHQLQRLLEAGERLDDTTGQDTTLLFIRILGAGTGTNTEYWCRGSEVAHQVAQALRVALRSTDILFAYGADEFVAWLTPAPPDLVSRTTADIRNAIAILAQAGGPDLRHINVSLTPLTWPTDGRTLQDLVAARDRARGSQHGAVIH